MNPDDFRRLVAAGMTTDQIAVVMEMMDREATKIAEAEEARREKGRERWHKWDAKRKANVSKREQTLANNSCEGVARGEDNLQTKDTSGEKERKVTSPSARSSRGSRIPENFQPDIEAAVSEGVPRPEAERQARSFCDYWRSKPGAGGLKLDWPATWRVWYRRNISTPPKPQATAPPTSHMAEVNSILDRIVQGDSNAPQHGNQTIDGSYTRTDRSGAPNLVQFDAVAARYRS